MKKVETTEKFARCIMDVYALTKNKYVRVDFPKLAEKHKISRSYDSVIKKLGYLSKGEGHTWKWVGFEPTNEDFEKIHSASNEYSRKWTTKKREMIKIPGMKVEEVKCEDSALEIKRLQEELDLYKRKSELLAELAKINDNLSKI
jgi:hypothetical protein